jgi:predicted Kef-type K+ transport protein
MLFGFAISLSSTALVSSMLRQWDEMETPAGLDAVGILLVKTLLLQLAAGAGPLAVIAVLARGRRTRMPIGELLRSDHEVQAFATFELCFDLAAVGLQVGVFIPTTYQLVIGVIAGTLLLGPAWVAIWWPLRGPSARKSPGAVVQ